MPFVPLQEVGVPGWLSGGVSHHESSSTSEQSIKFNVASYAMSNVRSLKHHEGGFQEKDLQVSFKRLQCSHYVKEIHTGAALTAEINLSSSVDMWSSETKASLSATMGLFPTEAVTGGMKGVTVAPKEGKEGEELEAVQKTAKDFGLEGLPFLQGLSDTLTNSQMSVSASISKSESKARSKINFSIDTSSRGIDVSETTAAEADALKSTAATFKDLNDGIAELKKEQEGASAAEKAEREEELSKLQEKVSDLRKALVEQQVIKDKIKAGDDDDAVSEHLKSFSDADKTKMDEEKKDQEQQLKDLRPEVKEFATTIGKYLEIQSKLGESANKNKETALMYTLVPIQAVAAADIEIFPPVAKMSAIDMAVAKQLGDVVSQSQAFVTWMKNNESGVQDDVAADFIPCISDIEESTADLTARSWSNVSPNREEATQLIKDLKIAGLKYTIAGMGSFKKCLKLQNSMLGLKSTMARFYRKSQLTEYLDKIDAAMDFEVKAARGYLDSNNVAFNGFFLGRARDQKRYDLAIATKTFIRTCRETTREPFSKEYDDMIKNFMEANLQYYANEADRQARHPGDASAAFMKGSDGFFVKTDQMAEYVKMVAYGQFYNYRNLLLELQLDIQ